MNISPAGLQAIREREALRLVAYADSAGIWTLGRGHISGVRQGDTCTEEQAEAWFLDEVASIAEACIRRHVKVPLLQNEYDALCSFIFNVGCSAFRDSTLLKKLNAGERAGAAEEFARWNHAGGKVVAGLTNRRAAERAQFDTPLA